MSEWHGLLLVLVLAFLPTEVWRSLAVLAARRLDPDSGLFHWVRAVATTLLAAVVAKLLVSPNGALAPVPRVGLFAALGIALAGYYCLRRSVLAAILVGEAAVILLVIGVRAS